MSSALSKRIVSTAYTHFPFPPGNQTENTSIKDDNLSPVYNEQIIVCWDGLVDLFLKVVDWDEHGDEEMLGQTKVSDK